MTSDERILVSQRRACHMLDIGRTKLWQLRRAGHLVTRKLGTKTMIEVASINRFIATLTDARSS